MNALAAFLVGVSAGMTPEEAAEALSGYAISGMRQRVRLWNGMEVVEDLYDAAPDSMKMHRWIPWMAWSRRAQDLRLCGYAGSWAVPRRSRIAALGGMQPGWRTSSGLRPPVPPLCGGSQRTTLRCTGVPRSPRPHRGSAGSGAPRRHRLVQGQLLLVNLEEVLRAVFPDEE